MATATNESQSTATLANEEYGSKDMTWNNATFSWNSAAGTWDNPYTISNESLTVSSPTNEAQT